MAQILTKEAIQKINYETKKARTMKVYKEGNHGRSILSPNGSHEIRNIGDRAVRLTLSKSSPRYEGSAKQAEIHQHIEDCIHLCKNAGVSLKTNITHFPAGAENLFDYMRWDITARILDDIDLVPFLANTVQNDEFTDPVNPQWFWPYAAPFKDFTGRGDPVNLIEIKTGGTDSINFTFSGVGFHQDLYNQLFNDIFSALKVTEAVAEGYIKRKNDIVFSPIFNFAFGATKTVAAVAGGTYEQNIYDTLQNMLDALGLLRNYQTRELVDVLNGVTIMCNSTAVRRINRAINGRLQNGATVLNLDPISEITRIIPYNEKHIYYGEEDITYEGCGATDIFMFVPNKYYWLGLKRDLTHVTGEGDTFGITSMKEAWYLVWTLYNTQFFGGNTAAPVTDPDPTVMSQAYGWIITGTLPAAP